MNETAAASILRVVPGQPEDSFLLRKLIGPTLGEGLPMPIDDALTQPYIDLVERWIEEGTMMRLVVIVATRCRCVRRRGNLSRTIDGSRCPKDRI